MFHLLRELATSFFGTTAHVHFLHSNGLETGGASNGLCSESEGQVYSRGNKFPNSYAIMYAWYMPKDQPVNGVGGHTHDWESIVVWLSSDSKDAKYLGLAYSGHGGYTAVPLGEDEDDNFDGNKPLIKYLTNGITNHELSLGTEKGGEQPLIDWESLPGAARQALDQADFGSANVPFKWANFHNNLAKASLN